MHAFITQHVNWESIMRWRRAQLQPVRARALPPSLVSLWQFALVSQHTHWLSKYMLDLDPNRLVHEPAPVWVEHQGGTYKPTELEAHLWSVDSAGAPKLMRLATEMEQQLYESVSLTDPALEDMTLAGKLEALSGSGWAILND